MKDSITKRTLGRAAVDAALKGWHVFPLNGKTPLRSSRGFHDATSDLEEVSSLWKKHPEANIGLYPAPSGLLVIDVDGEDGRRTARGLGLLDTETLRAVTGRADGGLHLYFVHPSGTPIGNAKIGVGLDVRADHGYVVMPPSIHPDTGAEYHWENDLPLAQVPDSVLTLIRRPQANSPSPSVPNTDSTGIVEGERNAALASMAGSMRRRGMSPKAIEAALVEENEQRCEPRLDAAEVARIATSIGRYDPSHTLADRLRLAGLTQLDATPPMAAVSNGIRNLADLIGGVDPLDREATMQAAVQCLKEKGLTLDNARRLVASGLRTNGTVQKRDAPSGLLTDPTPWPEPVDGAELLDDLAATVRRFVVLTEDAAITIALWVLFAHAHAAFVISPLLGITSPTMRCGKSTLLELLLALVPRGLAASNVSPAAIFRAVDELNPTLIVDEADSFMKSDTQYINVLNSSWKRSMAVVIRCVGDNHAPTPFSTWGPKVVALIGQLPSTLDDRAIEIRLERRMPGEKIERLRPDRDVESLEPLKRKAWTFATANLKELVEADPEIPEVLDDRAQDNWRGLLALADLVGAGWPERARRAAIALDAKGLGREEAIRIQLLEDLRDIISDAGRSFNADGSPVTRFATNLLLKELGNREERPWTDFKAGRALTAAQLAWLLRPFGIRPKAMWLPNGKTLRGYNASAFADVFRRYLGEEIDR